MLGKIRSVASRFDDVAFLAVIGSTATRGVSFHDVDLAVKVAGEQKYDTLHALVRELSGALGVPEERIDVVDLDRADIEIKARVVREGVVVVDRGYLDGLRSELSERYWEHRERLDASLEEWLRSRDPTTVDPTVVKRRLDFVREELEFLEQHVLSRRADEVESSPVLRRLLEGGFQLVVEALVDVCRHVASAKGWLREYTAAEAVRQCAEHGVIRNELAQAIRGMIVLRNIIVHRYLDVDYRELYERAANLVSAAREFEKDVVGYLRTEAGRRWRGRPDHRLLRIRSRLGAKTR